MNTTAQRYIVARDRHAHATHTYALLDVHTQRTIKRYRSRAIAEADADFLNARAVVPAHGASESRVEPALRALGAGALRYP